jgi:hypothetical protein
MYGMSTNYEAPHCATSSIPSTSSLLGPNVILRTLFWNTLSLCFYHNVRDQVSLSYKTADRIIILYILNFTFLDTGGKTKDWTEW